MQVADMRTGEDTHLDIAAVITGGVPIEPRGCSRNQDIVWSPTDDAWQYIKEELDRRASLILRRARMLDGLLRQKNIAGEMRQV